MGDVWGEEGGANSARPGRGERVGYGVQQRALLVVVVVDHADLVVEGERGFGHRVVLGPGGQARAVRVAGLREVGPVAGHPLGQGLLVRGGYVGAEKAEVTPQERFFEDVGRPELSE